MARETTKKKRLDVLIHQKGLAESRSKAQALIMSGVVFVKNIKMDKPGTLVNIDSEILIKEKQSEFVSRGGIKLQAALRFYKLDVSGYTVLDIGASTGGFTDCLLKNGAVKVYAYDVGYGQFDWGLRNDERVVVRERINCRYLKFQDVGELVDLVVIDVSFISLEHIIKPAAELLKPKGELIVLIKPQFEVGKGEVGKGGVVRDEEKHSQVIDRINSFIEQQGFLVIGVMPSPIKGSDGNKEFLMYSKKK